MSREDPVSEVRCVLEVNISHVTHIFIPLKLSFGPCFTLFETHDSATFDIGIDYNREFELAAIARRQKVYEKTRRRFTL